MNDFDNQIAHEDWESVSVGTISEPASESTHFYDRKNNLLLGSPSSFHEKSLLNEISRKNELIKKLSKDIVAADNIGIAYVAETEKWEKRYKAMEKDYLRLQKTMGGQEKRMSHFQRSNQNAVQRYFNLIKYQKEGLQMTNEELAGVKMESFKRLEEWKSNKRLNLVLEANYANLKNEIGKLRLEKEKTEEETKLQRRNDVEEYERKILRLMECHRHAEEKSAEEMNLYQERLSQVSYLMRQSHEHQLELMREQQFLTQEEVTSQEREKYDLLLQFQSYKTQALETEAKLTHKISHLKNKNYTLSAIYEKTVITSRNFEISPAADEFYKRKALRLKMEKEQAKREKEQREKMKRFIFGVLSTGIICGAVGAYMRFKRTKK